jgi:hypothetical protein
MITENENIYYVYILFKTYKTGIYKYEGLTFDTEPFYVGRGKNKRISESGSDIKKTKNLNKINIIKKIHSENLTVTSTKYMENMSEADAFLLEIELIKKIGRSDKGHGPLANLTDGGEGGNGGTSRIGDWPELYKPVLQYSLDGKFLKRYNSIKSALLDNPKSKNISYCCQLKRYTSGGYIWRYDNDEFKNSNIEGISDRTQKGSFPVSVVQKNMSGETINIFQSIKEAALLTGCASSKIVLVCQNKRKHTKRFIFEYIK